MHIGVVGLCEAGNLGDDLIFLSLAHHIARSAPGAKLRFLSHRYELNRAITELGIDEVLSIERVYNTERPMVSAHTPFDDCDIVFFGGGGLLQTTHHPLRPYHWLRFLPRDRDVRVVAIGLGVGPVSRLWQWYFTRLGKPFDYMYLRDIESIELAGLWGWQGLLSKDLVSPTFVRAILAGRASTKKSGCVGIAVRSWPGLSAAKVAAVAESIAADYGLSSARIFVLESKSGRGVDVDFSEQIALSLNMSCEVIAYTGDNLVDFVDSMSGCDVAVSMKYHSSVIWASFDVPLVPITYAPKTSALFGHVFRGLEVLEGRPRTSILLSPEGVEPAELVDYHLTMTPDNSIAYERARYPMRNSARYVMAVSAFIVSCTQKFKSDLSKLRLTSSVD